MEDLPIVQFGKYKGKSILELLADEKYLEWFYNDLNYMLPNSNIKGWFYGHTHTESYKLYKGIPFCCNPSSLRIKDL